jgi:pyrroline-5-carboxylate reductase
MGQYAQESRMLPQKIGFVGAGQMAQSLARGFVAAGLVDGRRIAARG